MQNGYGDGKGTHVYCYVCLMTGEYDDTPEWPFQGEITIKRLNQVEDINHWANVIRLDELTSLRCIRRVFCKDYGNKWGLHKFISLSEQGSEKR